jgi:hypothetical protein
MPSPHPAAVRPENRRGLPRQNTALSRGGPHGSSPGAEGPRPAGNRVTRLDPIVKLAQIQAFDKRPNQPRPVVVRQLAVQIDHIPAQLSSVWTNDPHPVAHSIRRTPPIGFYHRGGTSSSYGPNFSGLDYILFRRESAGKFADCISSAISSHAPNGEAGSRGRHASHDPCRGHQSGRCG